MVWVFYESHGHDTQLVSYTIILFICAVFFVFAFVATITDSLSILSETDSLSIYRFIYYHSCFKFSSFAFRNVFFQY